MWYVVPVFSRCAVCDVRGLVVISCLHRERQTELSSAGSPPDASRSCGWELSQERVAGTQFLLPARVCGSIEPRHWCLGCVSPAGLSACPGNTVLLVASFPFLMLLC